MQHGTTVALLVVPPLVLLFFLIGVGFYPPLFGNSRAQDLCLTAGIAVSTYLIATVFISRLLRNIDLVRRALTVACAAVPLSLLLYVVLASTLTEAPGGITGRLPVGLFYSRDFLDILPTNSNDVTVTKEEFQYDVYRIYRPWSVTVSTILIFGTWMSLFASLGVFLVSYGRLRHLEVADVNLQRGGNTLTFVSTSRRGLERTIRDRIPQQDPAVWRERSRAVEGQVCRVEIDGNPAGTAFLVGASAVITNYHVVEELINQSVAANRVAVRFDYKLLGNNSRTPGVVVGLHPTRWNLDFSPYADCDKRGGLSVSPTIDELDYALLLLEQAIGLENYSPGDSLMPYRRGWLSLPGQLPALLPKAPLVIVQHPDGAPLKLAIDTEAFLDLNANSTRMRYTTNTKPGSSGSPVFDFNWNLVAMHHLGDPAFDKLSPEFNQGIPVDAIRRRILDPSRPDADGRIAAISDSM